MKMSPIFVALTMLLMVNTVTAENCSTECRTVDGVIFDKCSVTCPDSYLINCACLFDSATCMCEDPKKINAARQITRTEPDVVIYQNDNYDGGYFFFYIGDQNPDFNDIKFDCTDWLLVENCDSWNNLTSSMKVKTGITAVLYEHAGYGGKRIMVEGPATLAKMPEKWNNLVSSMLIVKTGEENNVLP
ncbi:hypothetical protein [Candidatus Parabeggiatoa sp. HSG14]|uniref:hypothetical protein n=1 Tax=Candidatus Parabeggiatoa sp. HSG14 TaxID=3055593 RepID=UPI0025A897AD|nr:hypothetical protein [Thiotrichales bacterium HSG14]